MSESRRSRARILLIADPDGDPALVKLATAILAAGNIGVAQWSSIGDSLAYKQEVQRLLITDPAVDLVVVIRSYPSPSREVSEAVGVCRELGKPVHALVLRGVPTLVDVDEAHTIALDGRSESDTELHAWAEGLAKRFDRPV